MQASAGKSATMNSRKGSVSADRRLKTSETSLHSVTMNKVKVLNSRKGRTDKLLKQMKHAKIMMLLSMVTPFCH